MKALDAVAPQVAGELHKHKAMLMGWNAMYWLVFHPSPRGQQRAEHIVSRLHQSKLGCLQAVGSLLGFLDPGDGPAVPAAVTMS